ncbi:MAG: hypothetical protein A3I72_11310 [Candidatus Tectomicrobia bacterium RIFCSPLOWO2_02_FULL_70_19]|nr:MAG: hypothetical protein A3I72_11310 [Candidatus Tectomicrobia bacterium RIFCSPLOWO2_02_FULL_70_19]
MGLTHLFRGSRSGVVGFGLTAMLLLAAVFGPALVPTDPNLQSIANAYAPPSWAHPFGLDIYGRDTFARVIHGSRVSLFIGFVAVVFGGTLGTLIGALSALEGGRVDRFVVRATDILLSFPTLILSVIVIVALGNRFTNVVAAVSAAMLPKFVRYARGPTLAIREQDFVQSATALGAGKARIFFRHVLPSILGPVMVMAALWVGIAIRIEASLSFLGLGVQPPTPAWGTMLKEGVESMLFTAWLALFPGLAIMVTIFGLNLLGDWLRDVVDPYVMSLARRAEGEGAAETPGAAPAFSREELARMG